MSRFVMSNYLSSLVVCRLIVCVWRHLDMCVVVCLVPAVTPLTRKPNVKMWILMYILVGKKKNKYTIKIWYNTSQILYINVYFIPNSAININTVRRWRCCRLVFRHFYISLQKDIFIFFIILFPCKYYNGARFKQYSDLILTYI